MKNSGNEELDQLKKKQDRAARFSQPKPFRPDPDNIDDLVAYFDQMPLPSRQSNFASQKLNASQLQATFAELQKKSKDPNQAEAVTIGLRKLREALTAGSEYSQFTIQVYEQSVLHELSQFSVKQVTSAMGFTPSAEFTKTLIKLVTDVYPQSSLLGSYKSERQYDFFILAILLYLLLSMDLDGRGRSQSLEPRPPFQTSMLQMWSEINHLIYQSWVKPLIDYNLIANLILAIRYRNPFLLRTINLSSPVIDPLVKYLDALICQSFRMEIGPKAYHQTTNLSTSSFDWISRVGRE